jgi:hypothetical protein
VRSHQSAADWHSGTTEAQPEVLGRRFISREKEASEFASLLEEAGWIVSGPHVNENICAKGVEIGVRDPASPCPSAHLLLDVLISVGLNARLVKTAEPLSSASSSSCCLQFGRQGSSGGLGQILTEPRDLQDV